MKSYQIIVQSLWRFSQTIVVEAESKDTALARALDDHQCDWSHADRLDLQGLLIDARDSEDDPPAPKSRLPPWARSAGGALFPPPPPPVPPSGNPTPPAPPGAQPGGLPAWRGAVS